jgi:hypothetical protein
MVGKTKYAYSPCNASTASFAQHVSIRPTYFFPERSVFTSMSTMEQRKPEALAALSPESGSAARKSDKVANGSEALAKVFKPTGRFWAIIFTCAAIGLLSALENTVVTTALPRIASELELNADYIWVTNVFFLTGYD